MSEGERDDPEVVRRPANPGPRTAPAFTPAARWVAEHQVKALCMVVAVASPLASLWMLMRGAGSLHDGVWAYSVDGAGTIHYGPVQPADARSALFREILLQAAQACFTRNPSGLSYPEVARRIFVGESWRTLEEVEAIDVLDEGSSPRYRVRGFIVRSGSIEGLAFQPPAGEFHLIVELRPQEEALQQGRYPFVVVRHRAALRWPAEDGSK